MAPFTVAARKVIAARTITAVSRGGIFSPTTVSSCSATSKANAPPYVLPCMPAQACLGNSILSEGPRQLYRLARRPDLYRRGMLLATLPLHWHSSDFLNLSI